MNIFPKEDYYGNIEYKRYFYFKDYHRFQKYTTQLNYRLHEGNGRAIYIIGIDDNGTILGLSDNQIKENINFFLEMCNELKVNLNLQMNCIYKDKKFIIISVKSDRHRDSF